MAPNDEIISRKHILVEDDRTGTSLETLRRAVLDNLFYIQGIRGQIGRSYGPGPGCRRTRAGSLDP
jgi:hypothetical protein